jgi:glutamyl-tRNA synthetase
MKLADDQRLTKLVTEQLAKRAITPDERLPAICALFKDRCETTQVLADWASAFYATPQRNEADYAQHVTEAVKPAIAALSAKLQSCEWNKASLAAAIKETLAETGLKMPQLAMPVRVLLMGKAQTPSLDAILELCGQKLSLERLNHSD